MRLAVPHIVRDSPRLFSAVLVAWMLAAPSPALAEVATHGFIHVKFEEPDRALAERAVRVLTEAVEKHKALLPRGEEPIFVAICPTKNEFERYAGPYGQPNVVGIAFPDKGIIAVKTPRILPPGSDIDGTLRHELIHVLIERNTDPANVPRWFNEGLAMSLSNEHRWESTFYVARMYMDDRLIPLHELDLAFMAPGREGEFNGAYAQALSMTNYLRERLGEDRFQQLIRALDSKPFHKALEDIESIEYTEFYDAWRATLWRVAVIFGVVSGFSIFQVMAILAVVGYFRKRRQGKLRLAEWEQEEAEDDKAPFMTVRQLEDQEPPYPWEEEDEEYP